MPLFIGGCFSESPPGIPGEPLPPGTDPTAVDILAAVPDLTPAISDSPPTGDLTYPSQTPTSAFSWTLATDEFEVISKRVGPLSASYHVPIQTTLKFR